MKSPGLEEIHFRQLTMTSRGTGIYVFLCVRLILLTNTLHILPIQAFQVTVALSDENRLLQCRAWWELGIKYNIHFFQRPASRLHAKYIPDSTVNDIETNKDEVVPPIDCFEGDGRDICIIEIRAVG